MRGDAEPVDQPLVIEARSARARDRDAADAVGPDLARVRGDLITVGGVGGGEGEHGLFLRAHLVDRGADFGERHLTAAEEAVEVEHDRSEEPPSELQSLMRISYAVFCLKKKKA